MQNKRDIKAVERDLSAAIVAYRSSQADLGALLRILDVPDTIDASLISFTEEFGIDGTLKALRDKPQAFTLARSAVG